MTKKHGSLGARCLNGAAASLMVGGLVMTVSASRAILEDGPEAVSVVWVWVGALACLFLAIQLVWSTWSLVRGTTANLSWGSARLLLILLVAIWGIVLAWGQPFHPTKVYMALGLWIGLFSLLLTLRSHLLAVIPNKLLRVADLLLTNLCLVALGAELALRAVSDLSPSPILARNRDTAVDRIAKYRLAPGTVRYGYATNSRGYYDREFPLSPQDGKVIASIGDSFSAGVVPLPYHFTKVLENRLENTAVYNLGVPSIGPREYLYLLVTEALPLDPDLLLVNVFIGNDVVESHHGQQQRNVFLRSWFDPSNVLIHLVPVRVVTLLRADPSTSIHALVHTQDELHEMLPWVLDPMLEVASFSEEAFMEIESVRARQMQSPNITYERLFYWLTRIREAAGEIPLMIALIPDEYQAEEDLWEKVRGLIPQELERFKHQRIIGAWLEEQGIPYLDLLPHMRSVEPLADGRRHIYRLRDTHLNVRGNAVAGVALADFITENLGYQKKSTAKDR